MGRHTWSWRGRRREAAPIELTNLADLALILAFTGLLVPHLVMVPTVDLATTTGPAVSSVPGERVAILLGHDGTVYWNREVVAWAELTQRIQAVKAHTHAPKIFLMGERQAPLGLNIDVRTLLQGTDFLELAMPREP
jgi:biopolymer transport protein ExbD